MNFFKKYFEKRREQKRITKQHVLEKLNVEYFNTYISRLFL